MRYWGYVHENGSIKVKPFYDEKEINDAEKSDSVSQIFRNIEATNEKEAYTYIKNNQMPRFVHEDEYMLDLYDRMWRSK